MKKHCQKVKKQNKNNTTQKTTKEIKNNIESISKDDAELSHKDEIEIRVKRITLVHKVLSITSIVTVVTLYSYFTLSNIENYGRIIIASVATSTFIFSYSILKYIIFEFKNITLKSEKASSITHADNAYKQCWNVICPVLIVGTVFIVILEIFCNQFISNNANIVVCIAAIVGVVTEILDWFIKNKKAAFINKIFNIIVLIITINVILSFILKSTK